MGKLGEEEDEEGEPAIECGREYTVFEFDLDEIEEQVICHASALTMTDEARAIFITSVSSSKSLLSLTAFSISADHQALGWRLMQLKGMEDLAAFSTREVKKAAAEEREKDKYSSAEGQ